MPEKIMKTLWDIDYELHDETMSTDSVVSNTYTSGDIPDLRKLEEQNELEQKLEEED